MTVTAYQEIVRYATLMGFSFFSLHIIVSIISYRYHNIKAAISHILMCSCTAVFCITLFVGTRDIPEHMGDQLLWVGYVLGFSAVVFYFNTMEYIFNIKNKKILIARWMVLFLVINHLIFLLTDIFFDFTLVNAPKDLNTLTLFEKGFNLTYGVTSYGQFVGAVGGAGLFIGSITFLYNILKVKKKDYLMAIGIICSLIFGLNDLFLALTLISWMIPLYFLGNIIEAIRITEHFQKRAFLKIQELEKQKIEDLDTIKEGQFSQKLLRLLSHDISNGIMMAESSLKRLKKQDDNFPKYMKIVENGVAMIKDISTNVMLLEANKSGKLQVKIEEVSLRDSFTKLASIFEEQCKQKEIEINYYLQDYNEKILAESSFFLSQVMCNIISNGIKFSHRKSNLEIRTTTKSINATEMLIIKIQDTGVGMTDELKSKIFDYDVATSTQGTEGERGTGFGMPLVKMFVESFEGTIDVKSEIDFGTTYILSIPKVART